MADLFQVQYEELKKIQSQIDAEANNIMQIQKQITGQVNALRSGMWVGDSANAFYTEMDGLILPGIDRLQQALSRFSQEVNRIHTNISQAEQTARGRFNA